MLSINRATKSSRGFLSPLFFFNLSSTATATATATSSSTLISTTSHSATPSLYCYFYCYYSAAAAEAAAVTTPLQRSCSHGRTINAKYIALSFKEWFKRGNNDYLDRIFDTIRRHGEDKEALAVSLSQLRLPLTESFVLDVLGYGSSRHEIYSCVKFFDWAGHGGGFFHTSVTFHAFFKILLNSKGMNVILNFLDEYRETRVIAVHHHVRFYTILVVGYAIAGKPDTALRLFGKMRFQGVDLDAFSYHVLLNALVEKSYFDAFEEVFKQILVRGCGNNVTQFLKVKCLCKQKLLNEAEEHFRKVISEGRTVGFGYGEALGTLVDGFCKDGAFVKARELIEELSELGTVPMEPAYGIWLKNLVHAGMVDEASMFLTRKKSLEGYVPEVFRYNFLLCRLLRDNHLEDACDVLIEMKENQLSPDKFTMNIALCFFCKAGMVNVALELYKSISDCGFSPNTMAYNYLINSLCGRGACDEAYSLLKNSVGKDYFPRTSAFSLLARALYVQGKLDMMMDLILLAKSLNIKLSDSIHDKLISALCSSRRIEDAFLIHGELNSRNRVATPATYSSLINGFSRSCREDIASRLLIEMQDKGHKPIPSLFRSVFRCLFNKDNPEMQFFKLLEMQLSCHGSRCMMYNIFIHGAGHGKKPELAREVFELMQRNGVAPNLRSYILVVKAYLMNERISEAFNFFYSIDERKRMTKKLYSAMVIGLCKIKRTELAFEFLDEMQRKGIVPTVECHEAVVMLLCSVENYDMVISFINDIKQRRFRLTSFMGNVLLLHSLRSDKLYEAWVQSRGVQNEMSSDLSILGLLIGVFSGRLSVRQEIKNLEEVIEQCFPIDIYTYNMLLRRVSKSDMDDALELFYRLCEKGYKPNRWTYDILVHGFLRHGRIAEARRYLDEMFRKGFEPTECTKQFIW